MNAIEAQNVSSERAQAGKDTRIAADAAGILWAVVAAAITALAVVPLMLNLAPRLHTENR